MNSKFVHVKYLAIILLGVVILLLVSFDAFSDEIDLGGSDTMVMKASQSITKEVVTYDPYEGTCYRDIQIGSHTVCSPGRSERRCRKVPGVGEECWDEVTEEICSDEPIYRSEAYSCTKYARRIEHVHDYSVDAKIDVVKSLRSKNFDLNGCALGVNLAATSEVFYARCMNAIVKGEVFNRKEVMKGRDKERSMKIELDFFSIEGLNALKRGLNSLEHSDGIVSFVTGDLSEASNYKLSVKLTRNRLLLKDKVLLLRELKNSDYTAEKLGNGMVKITLNLAKMVTFDSTKKHTLNITLAALKSVDVKGALNTPTLSNSLSESIVIND